MLTIIVIAKECIPGRVKTRLTPDLTAGQAAAVAAASLADTLEVVRTLPADRRVLAFDGNPDNAPSEARGFEIVPQSSGGLDDRLAALFDEATGPTLLVGMDTPQLTHEDLAPVVAWAAAHTAPASWQTRSARPVTGDAATESIDAWFGFATDGGFWALALSNPTGSLIRGVGMSQDDTGAQQLRRLHDAHLRVGMLPELTDVDTVDDAVEVAITAPTSRFARVFATAQLHQLHQPQAQLLPQQLPQQRVTQPARAARAARRLVSMV
ncbi:TIGR04282 family arsenosugar biosynthesis glycosyltransferase [Subtercola sp. RTI3]|uniref:TIGR04282 family arsenosugar biosynthesis glycosyltransferase n=1 Tax=Subtercola sp. RTI3 TaxID=3048639 RepID=UPI002B23C494|nr:DUF2064 domain-containing protein [Subtercola sp. RTI3]MEA9985547.1 DUF2064 domain-containing protein [Subtercola sp. RTI3]